MPSTVKKNRRHSVSLNNAAFRALKGAKKRLGSSSMSTAILGLEDGASQPRQVPAAHTAVVTLNAIPGTHSWFADSKFAELRSKVLSFEELVSLATQVSGIPVDVLAREGLVLRCKAAIQAWHIAQSGADVQRAGQADDRLAKAYVTLVEQKLPVTFARLATAASTNYNTARRWMLRTHPDQINAPAAVPQNNQ